ncbi:N-acetylglucosamine-6-phosphate deacetylase [Euhalothece natronophila Z-M001]|uniref:N-acetylglucosamine-6-phosphate deacetylase n=1 Tax=Euhalothece natronophila Z-M001 TaxID=522448 RepID=A0A5B8NPE4_9CHRO|nr:N-acetylglucosamine-6-phosphate deacetylase [Euhalothece natronophila]QDZ40079.1 N-acetylglucosamine-6-phosphate deacetylase [Euhalothece natronophila Z-M001]
MAKTSFYITNARLPKTKDDQCYELLIENGKIKNIQVQKIDKTYEKPVIDFAKDWLSLGGADLQINGALGLPFPELTLANSEQLLEISKFLWQEGIDFFLPTIITSSPEKINTALATISQYIKNYQKQDVPYAKILGVHLEGPFLNPEKRGAHPKKYILPFTIDNLVSLIGKYSKHVRVLTCAPEISSEQRIISEIKLRYPQIKVSLGHSLATEEDAEQAFREGASMVTHAFNAMPSLHHREPGLLGSALTHSGVKCGFIADGEHISPKMLKLLLRMGEGSKRLFLVSDALAPLGLGDGVYPWDQREVTVRQGTARLEDGTLAGTTVSLLSAVANLVKWGICDVGSAIALATESPRDAITEEGLGVGQPVANLLRWHWNNSTQTLTWQRLINTESFKFPSNSKYEN